MAESRQQRKSDSFLAIVERVKTHRHGSLPVTTPRKTEDKVKLPMLKKLPILDGLTKQRVKSPTPNKETQRTSLDIARPIAGRFRRLLAQKEKKMGRMRRFCHFFNILFKLWRQHAQRVHEFMEMNVDMVDLDAGIELMFDVSAFKANKQARISAEARKILQNCCAERSEEDQRLVRISLGNYHSLAAYPPRMQQMIAQKAWYEKYDAKRVILRQGHPARCVYFILNGSVVVTKAEDSGISRTVCFLNRGEWFGELGIINKLPRVASVISKEPVELLVFGQEIYIEIFMSGGLTNPKDQFLQSLSFLKNWPLHLLAQNTTDAFVSFFKPNTVLVRDSRLNDWLYIVRSGSCRVLKSIKQPHAHAQTVPEHIRHYRKWGTKRPPLTEHSDDIIKGMREADLRSQGRSLVFRKRMLRDLGIQIKVKNEATEKLDYTVQSSEDPFITKVITTVKLPPPNNVNRDSLPDLSDVTSYLKQLDSKEIRKRSLKALTFTDQLNEKFHKATDLAKAVARLKGDEPTKNQLPRTLVHIRRLTRGDVFGLSDVMHKNQPSLSLVSLGSECIMINKRFFLDHLTKENWERLAKEIPGYPDDRELEESLQVLTDWQKQKQTEMKNTVIQTKLRRRRDIHDSRSDVTATLVENYGVTT